MSHNIRRSILSVPGHIGKMHVKAAVSAADVVMLDLEDSVPVNEKTNARNIVIQSLNSIDWGEKTVSIRINALDTEFFYDDIISLYENCGNKIDSLVIPKVENAGDIHFYDRLLTGIEKKSNFQKKIKIEASIESAGGLNNILQIAKASDRIISLVFGIADFTTSLGARLVSLSGHGENEDAIYPGDRWNYLLFKIAAAAREHNLFAIDAPYGNFKDDAGLAKSCQKTIALGFDGKWAIHPAQIETINQVYSPSDEEILFATKIVEAETEAARQGAGAVAIDGRMIDGATIRLAKKRLEIAASIKR